MAKLETVAICHPLNRDCMIRINKADYIPGKHTLWAEHGAGESSTQPEPVLAEESTAIEVEEPSLFSAVPDLDSLMEIFKAQGWRAIRSIADAHGYDKPDDQSWEDSLLDLAQHLGQG